MLIPRQNAGDALASQSPVSHEIESNANILFTMKSTDSSDPSAAKEFTRTCSTDSRFDYDVDLIFSGAMNSGNSINSLCL